MNPRKTLAKALNSPHNLRFTEMASLFEAFGFELARINGSHHIFERADVPQSVNLQSEQGKAKAYQVRQFIDLIERHDLKLGSEE